MTAYAGYSSGTNISQFPSVLLTQDEAMRSLERGSTAPTIKPVGLLWNDTSDATYGECIKRWNGSTWDVIMALGSPAIAANGEVVMSGNLDMGNQKITNLAAGTTSTDAARYGQVMLLSGANAMTGAMNLGGFKATNAAAATASTDLARFDQITPGRTAELRYVDGTDALLVDDDSDTVYVQVDGLAADNGGTFAPRLLYLRLEGAVSDQADSDVHGTIGTPVVYTVLRWTDGPGSGSYTVLGTFTVGLKTIEVSLKWKTSGPGGLGFWLKAVRTDSGERVNIATVRYMAISGVNQ